MNSRHANPAGARTDKEGRPSAMIATVICCRHVKLEDRGTEARRSPQQKRSRQSDSVEGMCSERHGTGRPRSCSEKPVFGKAQGGRSSRARTSQSLQNISSAPTQHATRTRTSSDLAVQLLSSIEVLGTESLRAGCTRTVTRQHAGLRTICRNSG